MRKHFSARRTPLMIVFVLFLLAAGAFALSARHIWPSADGTTVYQKKSLYVDASHADEGYIMVHGEPTKKHLKIQIKCGNEKLTYDLNSEGRFEVFPLQLGDGKYSVQLYIAASGNKYSDGGSCSFKVKLNNRSGPFLTPNQYICYDADTRAVAISDEICQGLESDADKFNAIRDYILANYTYDYAKAKKVKSGELPSIEYALNNRMGICQDLAALACCMLRVQGIPTRLDIGYCDNIYHAWDVVYIDGKETIFDPTMDIGNSGKHFRYRTERFY